MKNILFAAVLAAALLAACSGGGGGGGTAPIAAVSAAPQTTQTPGVAGPQNGTRGSISLVIPSTGQSASSNARKPSFVSPGSSSVGVTVNGSTGMYDVSGTSPYCSILGAGRSCTLPISVPVGTTNVNVSVSVYSGLNGGGSLLGSGAGSTTMSATATTFGPIAIDVNPAVASITATIAFGNLFPRFLYGMNEAGTLTPIYKDASGAIIPSTSTSPFLTPITLSANDPSISFSSSNVVTNAAQTVQVTYSGALCTCPSVTLSASGGGAAGSLAIAMSGYATSFPVTGAGAANPFGIAVGPDGNLWFTERGTNMIGTMSTAGVLLHEYPIATGSSSPTRIVAGPTGDTHMWFNEANAGKIGRIDVSDGSIVEYTPSTGAFPQGLHAVGTGLWAAGLTPASMYNFNTSGTPAPVQPAAPTPGFQPDGVTVGPDNDVWVTGSGNGLVERYDPTLTPPAIIGQFTSPGGSSSQPKDIVTGPDGNLWYTESFTHQIIRMTPAGVATAVPLPGASSDPYGITAGADGGIWFTMGMVGKFGRIEPSSRAVLIYAPAIAVGNGITSGPDGNLWATANGAILRIVP